MAKFLTELQMRIMEVLWDREEASVAEVQRSLISDRPLARTTVATMLSRMETQGILSRRAGDGEQLYRPVIAQAEIRRSMAREVAERAFGGDVPSMVKELLGSEEVRADDLLEIGRILAEREAELQRRPDSEDNGEEGGS